MSTEVNLFIHLLSFLGFFLYFFPSSFGTGQSGARVRGDGLSAAIQVPPWLGFIPFPMNYRSRIDRNFRLRSVGFGSGGFPNTSLLIDNIFMQIILREPLSGWGIRHLLLMLPLPPHTPPPPPRCWARPVAGFSLRVFSALSWAVRRSAFWPGLCCGVCVWVFVSGFVTWLRFLGNSFQVSQLPRTFQSKLRLSEDQHSGWFPRSSQQHGCLMVSPPFGVQLRFLFVFGIAQVHASYGSDGGPTGCPAPCDSESQYHCQTELALVTCFSLISAYQYQVHFLQGSKFGLLMAQQLCPSWVWAGRAARV